MKSHLMKVLSFLVAAGYGISLSAGHLPVLVQNGPAPGPSETGIGGWDGGYISLTEAVNSQNNQAAFPQVASGPYTKLNIKFDLRISEGNGGGADGVGFVYADSATHGTTGGVPAFSEEANLANSFGVGFDTFNNGGNDDNAQNSISLHYNGAIVGNHIVDATADNSPAGSLEDGVVRTANISVRPVAGGSNVSVSLTDGVTTIDAFTNEFVAGLTPYDGRMIFNARTGGANSDQDIDNVHISHFSPDHVTTSVLYQFVPEPAGFGMIGMGAFMLFGLRRRR